VKQIEEITLKTLNLAKGGRKDAFETIMNSLSSRIYSRAYRLSNSIEYAKDNTQQTFMQLYININSINNPDHLLPWLLRTSLNIYLDNYRRNKKIVYEESLNLDHIAGEDYQTMNEYLVADKLDLDRYLNQLSETERLVVWLHCVEGYLHQEVAKKLHISLSNSKQLYRRSLKKLHMMIIKEET